MRALALLFAGCGALVGCGSDRTELMIGLATDLPTPSTLDFVRLQVYRLEGGGTPIVNVSWDLRAEFSLPGSLGLYSSVPDDLALHIVAEAYGNFASTPELRARREAIVSLRSKETRFLRLGLVAACDPDPCADGETCIEGTCTTREIDSARLPLYVPASDPSQDLALATQCDSGTAFIDTMTGQPMAALGTSCAVGVCQEGTCLAP